MIIICAPTFGLGKLTAEYLRVKDSHPSLCHIITPENVFERLRGVRGPVFLCTAIPPGFDIQKIYELRDAVYDMEIRGAIRVIPIHEHLL